MEYLERVYIYIYILPDCTVINPKHPNTGRELSIRHWLSSNSDGPYSLAIARLLEPSYSSKTNTPDGASSKTVGRKASALGFSLKSKCVCIFLFSVGVFSSYLEKKKRCQELYNLENKKECVNVYSSIFCTLNTDDDDDLKLFIKFQTFQFNRVHSLNNETFLPYPCLFLIFLHIIYNCQSAICLWIEAVENPEYHTMLSI